MNLKHLFILSALALAPRLQAQVSFGQTQKLNHDWRFSLSDDSLAARADYPDADWRTLDVPHDWSIEANSRPTWPVVPAICPAASVGTANTSPWPTAWPSIISTRRGV